MAFWSKKSDKPTEASIEGRGARTELADAALDAIGNILRTLGRSAFSLDGTPTEAIGRRFDAWARHILVRSRPPARDLASGGDGSETESASEDTPRGGVERDWPGLTAFVAEHRKRENQHVAETVAGLREAVRSFMRAATKLRQISGSADDSTKQGIDRLKKAVERGAPVELKREVMSVASELEALVQTRKQSEVEVTKLLAEKVRELTSQLEEARREGGTDPLTRLPNRRTLETVMEEMLELCQVIAQPVALAVIDIDDFKGINDAHGHVVGDQVLRHVADQLTRVFLRKFDLVARFAGDEFCVLLRDTNAADAKRLLQRAAHASMVVPALKGERVLTLSGGVVDMVLGDTPTSLLERADKVMYRAKAGGKNRIEVG